MRLAAGLAVLKMQLGRPGAVNCIETCGGESAAATIAVEYQPPKISSARMRRTCAVD